jgi:hypothetical protein
MPTGIATDLQSLVLTWSLKLKVKCPHCGQEHEIAVRDAYVDGVIHDARTAGKGAPWMQGIDPSF